MAKVVVSVDWIDTDGKQHKAGEEIEFPRETDDEKFSFDHGVAGGLFRLPSAKASDKG